MPQDAMNDLPANFARVDDRVLRGGAATAEQAKALAGMGVRSVVNLEWEASDDGIWALNGLDGQPVKLYRIRDGEAYPFYTPSMTDAHVVAALKALRDGPMVSYVQAKLTERVGVVIAAYCLVDLFRPIDEVLVEFKSFMGWWDEGDESYIRSIAGRREWFMEQAAGAGT